MARDEAKELDCQKPAPGGGDAGEPRATGRPSPAGTPETSPQLAEKVAQREAFFTRLHSDWALPEVNNLIHTNALRQKPAPAIDLDVAAVAGSRLGKALSDVVRVVPLGGESWRDDIEKKRPNLVLVDSDWLTAENSWRELLIGPNAQSLLASFAEFCRAREVPTAFWFDRDAAHMEVFREAILRFDYVFANHLCVSEVQKIRPDAISLPTFVDVGCYNPYKHRSGDWTGLKRRLAIVMARAFDYMNAREANGLSERVAKLFDQNFWLYEDRYNVRNNNQRMSPVERCRFLGCFHHEARASLLKTALAEVFPKEIYPAESPDAERHLFECFATKTVAITDTPTWLERFRGRVRFGEGENGFKDTWRDIAANQVEAAIDAHLNWRDVMEKHTYFELVEAICAAMGVNVKYSRPKEARISFIMPTIRPNLIPMAIELYKAQRYSNRELIVVLNCDGVDQRDIEKWRGGDDSIIFVYVPSDMPVGYAVNAGVMHMSGDYWAKMDDDDYYSPNYLGDINLYRKFLDFDIAGKGALFNYFEEQDRIILRSWGQLDRESHNFAGGTLVVKNEPENVHWPEGVRGFADIEFLTGRLVEGAHIASLDPFSHIQIRRSDSRLHTWTRKANRMAADFESDGFNMESVFI